MDRKSLWERYMKQQCDVLGYMKAIQQLEKEEMQSKEYQESRRKRPLLIAGTWNEAVNWCNAHNLNPHDNRQVRIARFPEDVRGLYPSEYYLVWLFEGLRNVHRWELLLTSAGFRISWPGGENVDGNDFNKG